MKRKSPRSSSAHGDDLAQFVPYLLNFVGGRWIRAFAPHAKRLGINYSTWRVLMALRYGGPLHLVEIADKANFDLSTLFRIVEDLEARKLLQRANHKRRGRTYAVELSPTGAKIVDRLLPIALDHEQKLLAALSDGERIILIEVLNRLWHAVSESVGTDRELGSRREGANDATVRPIRVHIRSQVDRTGTARQDRSIRRRAMMGREQKAPIRRV
jgi:DNA-binding MarR family transcriptional regulator